MSKGLKIFLITFISVTAAIITANLLTDIFKDSMKKYYTAG